MADPATDTPDIARDSLGGIDLDKVVRGALPSQNVDIGKIRGDLTEIGKQEAAIKDVFTDRAIGRMERDTAEVHRAKQGIDAVDLRPWNAEEEKRKYTTSPIEQFGSLGVIAATLASAFTRTPMANALNGAASAMTAIQEKDNQRYERAYEAFKTNAELAIKRHTIQREAYEDAIQMLNTDRTTAMSELGMLADKFGDKRARALLDGGYIKELIEYQNSQRAAYQGIAQLMPQLEQMNVKRQAADYLRGQGRNPAEVYREIYAPAYSSTVGNLKTQMIREEMSKNGGDLEAAVRHVEATFNPAKANLPANYAVEAIEGLKRDGVELDPATMALVVSTLGKSANSSKAAEVNSAVAAAMEEIRTRKAADGQVDTRTASQIVRDAIDFATAGKQKVDAAIVNMLHDHYSPETAKELKSQYLPVKTQEQIKNADASSDSIEHIAQFAADNPEAVGLFADTARRMNLDAYKALAANPSGYIAKVSNDRDAAIDVEAKSKGLSQGVVDKAKVLNKMLAAQAFADAAQAGSRGATIYLDKAFREIYQQASSLPAFFDILHVRERDANDHLSKYHWGLDARTDVDQTHPFWKNPEAFLERAVKPRASAPSAAAPTTLPPKEKREVGKSYPTPRGDMVWGEDGLWYTPEEWQTKSNGGGKRSENTDKRIRLASADEENEDIAAAFERALRSAQDEPASKDMFEGMSDKDIAEQMRKVLRSPRVG